MENRNNLPMVNYSLNYIKVSKGALKEALEILKGKGIVPSKVIKNKCDITGVNYILRNEENITIANVWNNTRESGVSLYVPSFSPIFEIMLNEK